MMEKDNKVTLTNSSASVFVQGWSFYFFKFWIKKEIKDALETLFHENP